MTRCGGVHDFIDPKLKRAVPYGYMTSTTTPAGSASERITTPPLLPSTPSAAGGRPWERNAIRNPRVYCRFAGASASWSSSNRPPMSHRKTDLGMPLPYTPSNPSTRPKRVPSKQIATCLFDVIPKESVNSALDFADSSPTILILQTIVAATPQPR